jgi:hypothetical protein
MTHLQAERIKAPICNPLKRGIEKKIFITVQNPLVYG